MGVKIFRNRVEAGVALGERVRALGLDEGAVVLALPRGGVPVAREVAVALGAPLDVLVVRKIGAPFNPELALGAIAFGGVTVYNEQLLAELGLEEAELDGVRRRELAELSRRERAYRGERPMPDLAGKTVVVVDDGMATGATMHAAVTATRALHPKRIVVAVPTSARDSVARLVAIADRVVALETPEPYFGVGAWYEEFRQVTDEEVVRCLEEEAARRDEHGKKPSDGEPRRA
jgi:predicted phosphoribosyltransferase